MIVNSHSPNLFINKNQSNKNTPYFGISARTLSNAAGISIKKMNAASTNKELEKWTERSRKFITALFKKISIEKN